jgi:hypothetical protein
MEEVLIASLVLIFGSGGAFGLGMLLMMLLGQSDTNDLPARAPVHTRTESPSRR